NGDGIPDAVLANTGSSVSVLLGRADGSFGGPADFATGIKPFSVLPGDLNGDGKLDLAVVNDSSKTVSVLLGHGDGTFGPRADFRTGPRPAGGVLVDLNGDGALDMVVAND